MTQPSPARHSMLKLTAPIAVVLSMWLSGCVFDQVQISFGGGISVYNFLRKEYPVQMIEFENGVPDSFKQVTIDGKPLATYNLGEPGIDDIPVRRDATGQVDRLAFHWSDRHEIKISYKGRTYQMPLTNAQLKELLGNPIGTERSQKWN